MLTPEFAHAPTTTALAPVGSPTLPPPLSARVLPPPVALLPPPRAATGTARRAPTPATPPSAPWRTLPSHWLSSPGIPGPAPASLASAPSRGDLPPPGAPAVLLRAAPPAGADCRRTHPPGWSSVAGAGLLPARPYPTRYSTNDSFPDSAARRTACSRSSTDSTHSAGMS